MACERHGPLEPTSQATLLGKPEITQVRKVLHLPSSSHISMPSIAHMLGHPPSSCSCWEGELGLCHLWYPTNGANVHFGCQCRDQAKQWVVSTKNMKYLTKKTYNYMSSEKNKLTFLYSGLYIEIFIEWEKY